MDTDMTAIAGKTLEEWTEFARKDYCLDRMVPSDLRQLVGEIDRLNKWADGFSDAQLKERQLCEARIQEMQREVDQLRAGRDAFQLFMAQLIVRENGASLNGNITIREQPFPATVYDNALRASNANAS
jgi:SMC interacting uncharacterized protein involved in chromosome segregation